MFLTLENIINMKNEIKEYSSYQDMNVNINVLDKYFEMSTQSYNLGYYYILNFKFKVNDNIPYDIIEKGNKNIESGMYYDNITNTCEYVSVVDTINNFEEFSKIIFIIKDIEARLETKQKILSFSKTLHNRLSENILEIPEDIIQKIIGYI